jgi:hypothetical protein
MRIIHPDAALKALITLDSASLIILLDGGLQHGSSLCVGMRPFPHRALIRKIREIKKVAGS